ncbi:flavin reductase family protein [Microbacterium karelineae]|uniref:flavin reductase family protein n=1 Tax=Microbacterium karelineae TaxID=2654283 RepID=UPI0012EAF4A7|nr:flavin reductase family protein [Microbacterium karelineae]
MTTLLTSPVSGTAPEPPPAPIDAEGFKSLFRGHPSGVAVITAHGPDGPVALTASSVASISVDPPLLIFSVSALSSASASIVAADSVVVHLLDAGDLELAELAATSGADRFADRERWTRLDTGEPLYHGVRAWTRAAIVNRLEAGGSTVIVAHALEGSIARDADHEAGPLVHHNRTWHRLDEGSAI